MLVWAFVLVGEGVWERELGRRRATGFERTNVAGVRLFFCFLEGI